MTRPNYAWPAPINGAPHSYAGEYSKDDPVEHSRFPDWRLRRMKRVYGEGMAWTVTPRGHDIDEICDVSSLDELDRLADGIKALVAEARARGLE